METKSGNNWHLPQWYQTLRPQVRMCLLTSHGPDPHQDTQINYSPNSELHINMTKKVTRLKPLLVTIHIKKKTGLFFRLTNETRNEITFVNLLM